MPSEDGLRRARARRAPHALKLVWVLALALATACGPSGDQDASSSDAGDASAGSESSDARLVRVVHPELGTLRATRSASADVRAVRDATVAAGASARVLEILARAGDVVGEQDVVIRLDGEQARLQAQNASLAVRQAEIDLERARRSSQESASQATASLRAAESNLRTLRERMDEVRALVAAGGASRSDLASLETQVEQAEAQAGQARDAVARAGRSENEDLALLEVRLEQARVQAAQAADTVRDSEVRAPFEGEIAELYLETGEFAGAGQPAFRLVSIDEREAVFDVPPGDASRLQERGEVVLRYAGRELTAELVASARPAEQPRLVRLTASLAPEDAATIPAGSLAEVRYEIELGDGALLPAGALSAEGGETWVYLVDDGVATRVPVEVRAETGARAVVDGVGPDDAIIYPRALDVREGTRVRTDP